MSMALLALSIRLGALSSTAAVWSSVSPVASVVSVFWGGTVDSVVVCAAISLSGSGMEISK